MIVELFNFTESPIKTIASAARCTIQSIPDTDQADDALVNYLISSNETSPLEHASITFRVFGLSRICVQQLTRHRIATYTQESMRFVTPNSMVEPPAIPKDHLGLAVLRRHYEQCIEVYNQLLEMGFDKDSARYSLPMGTGASLFITMNFRSLLNFFSQRLCGKASVEIRLLAKNMLEIAQRIAPVVFSRNFVDCEVFGKCRKRKRCKSGPAK